MSGSLNSQNIRHKPWECNTPHVRYYSKQDAPRLKDTYTKVDKKTGKATVRERPWAKRKLESEAVGRDLGLVGESRLAERLADCGSWLNFGQVAVKATGEAYRWLHQANFCKCRICPMCQWRRSKTHAAIFTGLINKALEANNTDVLRMLTLTVPNVRGEQLSDTIDAMMRGWQRLSQRTSVRQAMRGCIRVLEITYNAERDDYHPHFHILMVMTSRGGRPSGADYIHRCQVTHLEYLKRKKKPVPDELPQGWLEMWQESMEDTSITQVDIRAAKMDAIPELCKYLTKFSAILEALPAGERRGGVFQTLHHATFKRRLASYMGIIKELKQQHYGNVDEEDPSQSGGMRPFLTNDGRVGIPSYDDKGSLNIIYSILSGVYFSKTDFNWGEGAHKGRSNTHLQHIEDIEFLLGKPKLTPADKERMASVERAEFSKKHNAHIEAEKAHLKEDFWGYGFKKDARKKRARLERERQEGKKKAA